MQALFDQAGKKSRKVVVLGTGGTIAGRAAEPGNASVYVAGQVAVQDLLASVPGLAALQQALGVTLTCEQIAQIDSKDMDFATWQQLAARAAECLADDAVAGVVVTHGTDTLEESAHFLHRVLPGSLLQRKALVFTCAMRPANALQPDGPGNLRDAVQLAAEGDPRLVGVLAVCAGDIHRAEFLTKSYSHQNNAFISVDGHPYAAINNGAISFYKTSNQINKTTSNEHFLASVQQARQLPRVDIVLNHAGADGRIVDALLALGAQAPAGIVVAGTGNGTVSTALEAALLRAVARGVRVVRSTRCVFGSVQALPDQALPDTSPLTPVKARVDLMLQLLAAGR
ncbi:MAG: hypothetical protein RLZZ126_2116 [Pseudomonadota bacterium]|jgi:L-asparaginase